MNGRHTHELILDSTFRERVLENVTDPDVLRLLMKEPELPHSNCVHFITDSGHERAIPVELRHSNGRKVPVSVSRAVYVSVFGKNLGPDDDVVHTCGGEYVDLDGKRRPCVHPGHMTVRTLES